MRLIDADELKDDGANYEWAQVMDHGFAYKEHRFVNRKQIDDAPTIEAIPVWWIDSYCTDCSIDLRNNDAKAIIKLVKDWREENEAN